MDDIIGDVPVSVVLLGVGNNTGYRRDEMVRSGSPTLIQDVTDEIRLKARFDSSNPARIVCNSITLNGEIYSGEEFDLCGTSNFEIQTNGSNVTLGRLFNIDYDANVRARCTNSPSAGLQLIPNVHTFFSSVAGGTFASGRTNDRGNTNLITKGNPEGAVYASYNGQILSQHVTSEDTSVDFVFDDESCVVTTAVTGINGQ